MRRPMTEARKRRIWAAAGGVCYHCGEPVPMLGPDVRYDHVVQIWITRRDEDADVSPAHTTCDKPKTAADAKVRAKIKRILARQDGTRRERKPIPSRGFPEVSRPMQSRPWRTQCPSPSEP
jgi:5-methylcytosine-specific restriction enzyme A